MAYYGNSCTELIEHYCDPCAIPEQGRVRSIALISSDYFPTILADPSNHVLWLAGIAANKIAIVPRTNGAIPEPTAQEAAGFGNQIKQFVGYNYTGNFVDPNYEQNGNFWNMAKNATNRVFAYVTESYVHFSTNSAYITASAPVEDDIASVVNWKVKVEWAAKNAPTPFVKPTGVFECPPLT